MFTPLSEPCAILSFRSGIFPDRLLFSPRLARPFILCFPLFSRRPSFRRKARSSFYSPTRSRPRRVSFPPFFPSVLLSPSFSLLLPRPISMELIPGAVRKSVRDCLSLYLFLSSRKESGFKGFPRSYKCRERVSVIYGAGVISQNERYPRYHCRRAAVVQNPPSGIPMRFRSSGSKKERVPYKIIVVDRSMIESAA